MTNHKENAIKQADDFLSKKGLETYTAIQTSLGHFIREVEHQEATITALRQQLAEKEQRDADADRWCTFEADIGFELSRAFQKFPTWPTDPLHAVAVLVEEVGELQKAVLEAVYEPHKESRKLIDHEAVQVAAMARRFLYSIDRYQFTPGEQHAQVEHAQTGEG